jgi:uncharacterized protein YjbI with pentapeptide repeats
MANPEHVAILKQGVEVWNRWRRENPEIRPDFVEADLSGLILHNVDLSKSKLYKTNLSGVCF